MENIVIIDLNAKKIEKFREAGFKGEVGPVQDIITQEWMGHGVRYPSPLFFVSNANSLGSNS